MSRMQMEAIGLAVCIALVMRLDVVGFARQQQGSEFSATLALAD